MAVSNNPVLQPDVVGHPEIFMSYGGMEGKGLSFLALHVRRLSLRLQPFNCCGLCYLRKITHQIRHDLRGLSGN